MVSNLPYLPDILKAVVAKVKARTSAFPPTFNEANEQTSGPFSPSFDYGIYSQVSRNLYAKMDTVADSEIFPLFWLIMDYIEIRGRDFTIHSSVTFDVIIAMPTDKDYTSDERTDKIFKPILLPAYELFLEELAYSKQVKNSDPIMMEHGMRLRPYWGGGVVKSGGDTRNLFEKEIDAIHIQGIQLDIQNKFC